MIIRRIGSCFHCPCRQNDDRDESNRGYCRLDQQQRPASYLPATPPPDWCPLRTDVVGLVLFGGRS